MVDNALTKKPAFVQIMPTDTTFTTSDCQVWQLTNAPMPPQPGPGELLGQLDPGDRQRHVLRGPALTDDLAAVTAIGAEDHSGVDPAAIERIWDAAVHWYRAGMQPAIQVCLRQDGRVVLDRAIGHAWDDRPGAHRHTRSACTRRPRRSPPR